MLTTTENRLHDYQRHAVERILNTPKIGIFLEVGMGKSLTSLTAISRLKALGEAKKVLIIAPLRVANDTWAREVEKWQFPWKVSKLLGPEAKRRAALHVDADIYVINRENVPWLCEYYGVHKNGWPFDMVVIDELSSFKSAGSKRFKALKKVLPKIKRLVGLTGTPTPNGFLDLWAQIYLLDNGERLGKSMTQYQNTFFFPAKKNGHIVYEWKLRPGSEKTIQGRISDIAVSMRAQDYLTLPECINIETPIVLNNKVKKLYKELERNLLIPFEGADVAAESAAVLANKLLQMASGAVYDEAGQVHEIHGEKLDALEDIVEASQGKPVMVFYNYKHSLERLTTRFPQARTLRKGQEGNEDIRAWNNNEIPLLLLHPKSAGHGLNLQESMCQTVVWFDQTWSREEYEQGNGRVYRQGQKQAIVINHLIAEGTIDEQVVKALQQKGETQSALMKAIRARFKL